MSTCQQFGCFFNNLLRPTIIRTLLLCITGPFLRGIHWSMVDSPHNGSVMQKVFPCHAAIMFLGDVRVAFSKSQVPRFGVPNSNEADFQVIQWLLWIHLTYLSHPRSGWLDGFSLFLHSHLYLPWQQRLLLQTSKLLNPRYLICGLHPRSWLWHWLTKMSFSAR